MKSKDNWRFSIRTLLLSVGVIAITLAVLSQLKRQTTIVFYSSSFVGDSESLVRLGDELSDLGFERYSQNSNITAFHSFVCSNFSDGEIVVDVRFDLNEQVIVQGRWTGLIGLIQNESEFTERLRRYF